MLLNPKPIRKMRQKNDARFSELKSFLKAEKEEPKNDVQRVQRVDVSKEFEWTDSDEERQNFLGLKTDRSQEMSPQLARNRTQLIEDLKQHKNTHDEQERRLEFLLRMEKQNQNS